MDKQTIINTVILPIEKAGFKAYFVGGCVRDEVLGQKPHDYDIVTNARPDDIHKIFPNIIDINSESFGIVVINVNGENIEIATFRKDRECDGRHAEVSYADSMEEDAIRRDFTMNALYQDKDGKIYDPTGLGLKDIEAGEIRFIGSLEERCREDNLRLLRLFRFLATKATKNSQAFSLSIDQIKELIILSDNQTFIHSFNERVSGERIGKEMRKIISGKFAPKVIYCLAKIFGMGYDKVFPKEFINLKFQECNKKYHLSENNFDHSLAVFKTMCSLTDNFELRAAALFHDVGKSVCQLEDGSALDHEIASVEICEPFLKENWKLTNKEIKKIMHLIKHHMEMHRLSETKHPEKIWKYMYEHDFDDLLLLLKSDVSDVPKEYDDYKALVSHPLFEFFKKIEYPSIFTGKDMMEYVSSGKFLKEGIEAANADVARAMIKAKKYGATGKIISRDSILKQAKQRVLQLRKNEGEK